MTTRKVLLLLSTRLGCKRLFSVKTASVNCRRAILDDFEAVVNINENVLRGRDYVPATYHKMLTDPNISAYVAEVENKIVAFACARLLDGGRTFLLSSGRVHLAYQGHGIMRELVRHIKASYSNKTNIFYDIITATGGHPLLSQVRKYSFSEVLTRRVHCFAFPVNELPPNVLLQSGTQVSTPTQEYLEKLMFKNSDRLFPGGRLIVDWIPLRVDPQNVSFMTQNTYFHTNKSPERECLSFGTSHQCNLGLAYNLDVYGNHPESLRDHLYAHLLEIAHSVQRNRECCNDVAKAHRANLDRVHLLVFTCMTVDTAINEILQELGLKQSEWPVKTQVVMEKGFQTE